MLHFSPYHLKTRSMDGNFYRVFLFIAVTTAGLVTNVFRRLRIQC